MAGNKGSTLTREEKRALSEFTLFAALKVMGGHAELAAEAKISRSMVSYVISGTKPAGGKTIRAIADAMGVTVEEMLSGEGLAILRARAAKGTDRIQAEKRKRAASALATLFDLPFRDVDSIFDEHGIVLPLSSPAASWFDIARAYIERRQALAFAK
jgi:transcriptional regulator with XRE-family HTH domain